MGNLSLSSEVITILDDVAQRFGVVIDWTSKNVLPYITDLMDRMWTYRVTINWIGVSIGIILTIVLVLVLKVMMKKNFSFVDVVFVCFVGTITVAMFLIPSTSNLIELYTVPEVYFVQYFKSLKLF